MNKRTVTYLLCLVVMGLSLLPCGAISTRVHAFYYPWYRNMLTDGNWIHWADDTHIAPDNIAAAFYPSLGPYSANDPSAIHNHMRWLVDAGVGVIALSWWGQASREDASFGQIVDIADLYGIKCCFHMEPYGTRTISSLTSDVRYIIDTYGNKPGLFRDAGLGNRTVFYYFAMSDTADATYAAAWDSLRSTSYNSLFIADTYDHNKVINGHWDGFYNYFPGQSSSQWASHANWATNNNKIFVPPVGPGWDSTEVGGYGPAPIPRNRGAFYDSTWSPAIAAKNYSGLRYVGITSFNEWHEGTQIEPAAPTSVPGGRTYPDYLPDIPTMYIDKTASWAAAFDPANSGKIQCEDYSGGTGATEGVDYHDTTSGNSGGVYRSHRVDIEPCAEGGYNIGYIAAGEWLRYTNVNVTQANQQEIRIRGAAWNGERHVQVCDGSLSNVILTLTIPNTGGFQNWQTVSGYANLSAGAHTIYLYAVDGDFNLNWFEIRPDIYPPAPPSNQGSESSTTTSIRWSWRDNSTNETGFNVYADPGSSTPVTLRATAAANAVYWDYTGLTPNTQYSFQASAVNPIAESVKTIKYSRYTLVGIPSVGNNLVCNKTINTPYASGTTLTFSNPIGFGAGTDGGSPYRVASFQYAWDKNAANEFSGPHPSWAGGSLIRTMDQGEGSYYLHVRAIGSMGDANPTAVAFGPFVCDATPPQTTATPLAGVYSSGQTVALAANETATIYYTRNGFEPTTSSLVYTSPLVLTFDTPVRFFAVDSAGNQESPKKRENYYILTSDGSIAASKALGAGQQARLGNKVLYLKQGTIGYIEEQNRRGGIRIEGTIPAEQDQLVSLVGIMRKPVGAEPYIEITALSPKGNGSVEPFAASNRSLGYSAIDGLCVRVWGKVKPDSITGNSFVITDGSDEAGLKIITHVGPNVSENEFVFIDGAAGYESGVRVVYRR